MGGAFLTSRDIFSNDIWNDIVKFRIFFYIVGNAVFSHEGIEIAGISVQRGQYLRSLRNLQEDLSYREGRGNSIKKYPLETIRRKIKSLENEERITTKSTEYGTLFTVLNYHIYQDFGHYQKDSMGQRWDSNETAVRQRWDNNKKDNKDNKDNISSRHKFEICDMELAELLLTRMVENNPDTKEPNMQSWANEVRLMRERDNRTIEQIKYLINWTQSDPFWKTNILSISKLRKQFDQLVLKCKEDVEQKKRKGSVKKLLKKEDFNLDE